jgi:hypothetical protein
MALLFEVYVYTDTDVDRKPLSYHFCQHVNYFFIFHLWVICTNCLPFHLCVRSMFKGCIQKFVDVNWPTVMNCSNVSFETSSFKTLYDFQESTKGRHEITDMISCHRNSKK